MKSLNRGSIAGNAKLRGKKTKMLSCRCCTVENLKEEYEKKQAEKELREVCKRCGHIHMQDPVDPDKIIRDHANDLAREIDRQVLEQLRQR